MMVRYLCLVFLLEFRNVQSLGPGGHDSNSGLSSPTGSSSRYNPCNKTKMAKRAADANYACHHECMDLQKEIKSTYEANRKNMKLLYNNCGLVTQGQCDTVARVPVCWCITPNESKSQRKILLQVCRHGMQARRMFTNAGKNSANQVSAKKTMHRTNSQDFGRSEIVEAVGMNVWGGKGRRSARGPPAPPAAPQRTSSSSTPSPASSGNPSSAARQRTSSSSPDPVSSGNRSRSPPRRRFSPSVAGPSSSLATLPPGSQQEDFNTWQDGLPDGDTLYTHVRVKEKVILAVVDTGSAFTVIHRNFANGIESVDDQQLAGADNQQFTIHGQTTINLEVREGVIISVIGIVTDLKQALILGTDFFVRYKANIRIHDRWMDIFLGHNKVSMMIRFRSHREEISMTIGNTGRYMPLRIAVSLNGEPKELLVDTGAAVTVVNRSCVADSNITFVSSTCTVAGGARMNFIGTTFLMLQFNHLSVFQQAQVPAFVMPTDILGGNDFNIQYVERIDYKQKEVIMRFRDPRGVQRISRPARIFRDP